MKLDLNALVDGSSFENSVVYISSCSISKKKDGTDFVRGKLIDGRVAVDFKFWNIKTLQGREAEDLVNKLFYVTGLVRTYNGKWDLSISSISEVNEGEYSLSDFIPTADIASLSKEFNTTVNRVLSASAKKVLLTILKDTDVWSRFKEEYAGSSMHDAQVGGLFNHTMKMLRLTEVLVENEPRFELLENFKDMLYLSVILHDVGKVYEMKNGEYQENSFVTHRILGIELLYRHKEAFIENFEDGENFYYEIVSVLQGHHNEFGDKANTVLALIVHMIDMLESQTTGIFDRIERKEYMESKTGMRMKIHDSYYTV